MASERKGAGVRSRIGLRVEDIVDALNDSDLDFSGDDCDEDPEFLPPERTQRASYHDTSVSNSSDEDDYALIPTPASPALSDSSLSRSRSRGRGRSRRGRELVRRRGTNVGEESQQTQSSLLSIRQIARDRVPKSCILSEEKQFREKSRGSSEIKVREDGKLAVTMWLDNKPVLLMSTYYSDKNHEECERWSKKDKRYEKVRRPEVIKMYNQNMGGVDLTDRMLSACPSRKRTRKWTIRVISHLFDLAVVNSWLQYRIVEKEKGTVKKYIVQMREYKLNLGTKLVTDNEAETDGGSEGEEFEELEAKHKKRKVLIKPIPSKERRTKAALHLPEYGPKQSRCRGSGCDKKTTVFCKKCDIYLCFTPNRNCYSNFHEGTK